ncbi:MAG: hypothetical protein RLZZ540_799 [Bacteroidota bacterium]|jgi:hypothetical protein
MSGFFVFRFLLLKSYNPKKEHSVTRSRSFDTLQSLAQAFACAHKDCQNKSNNITSSSLSKLA